MKHLHKREEENQGKQVIEEHHGAVAQGQPHVAPEQCQVRSHSRRLFPVSSMKASSSDGRLMRMSTSSSPFSSSHFTISTTVRAGWPVVTAILVRRWSTRHCSASRQAAVRCRPAAPRVRSRWWRGPARVPEFRAACPGDDAAFIDDGHAVAQFLGLFDVMSGQ